MEDEEQDECPWNAWLQFKDRNLEEDFLKSESKNWSIGDAQIFTIGLVYYPFKFQSWRTPGLFATCFHHGWLAIWTAIFMLLSWSCKRGRWPYNHYKVTTAD